MSSITIPQKDEDRAYDDWRQRQVDEEAERENERQQQQINDPERT